ncbi:MAG: hypothetical protein AAGB25_02440 [Pseudomonadota bacterium]
MPKEKPIEIFTPPNALKAKIGGALSPIDRNAIAKAERALADLSNQFQDWMEDEIDKIEAAWSNYEAAADKVDAVSHVYGCAHDIKGLAPTYEYPFVSRVASSLCNLTSDELDRKTCPPGLMKAHVDAMRAAVKSQIKELDHPVGSMLLAELEERAAEHLQKIAA